MSEQTGKAPIQTLRDGAVVVKIWEQNGKNGPYPSATLGRTYKNEQTGEWGESRSLGRGDLLKAQALLLDANRELVKWQEYYKALQPSQTISQSEQPEQSSQGLSAQRDDALANAKQPAKAAPSRDRAPDL